MGRVKWLGHATFEVELGGKRLLIDPWIRGNPKAPCSLEELPAPDIILVTHDHSDHMGDCIEIAKRHGSTVVAIYELSNFVKEKGATKVIGMNVGGSVEVEGLKIVMTPAYHSSERGQPAGFIVTSGKASIYHAGDTALFSDIRYFAELYPITVAMIPIGGLFTMDPPQAARFVGLFKPKVAIPMHYGTFPSIDKDPNEFKEAVKRHSPGTEVVILEPGESYEFKKQNL